MYNWFLWSTIKYFTHLFSCFSNKDIWLLYYHVFCVQETILQLSTLNVADNKDEAGMCITSLVKQQPYLLTWWTTIWIKRLDLSWDSIEVVNVYMILNFLLLNADVHHLVKFLVWTIVRQILKISLTKVLFVFIDFILRVSFLNWNIIIWSQRLSPPSIGVLLTWLTVCEIQHLPFGLLFHIVFLETGPTLVDDSLSYSLFTSLTTVFLHHLPYNISRIWLLNVQYLVTFILNKCELVSRCDLVEITYLLKIVYVLDNIFLFILSLTKDVNVCDLLEMGMWLLFDASLVTDKLHGFNPFNFQIIVRVKNGNLVLRIYVEVLLMSLHFIFLIVFYEINLLYLDTSIIVPYFLEDIWCLSWKHSYWLWFFFLYWVRNLNSCKHVLDNEHYLRVCFIFIYSDVVNVLDLSVDVISILVHVFLLLCINDF